MRLAAAKSWLGGLQAALALCAFGGGWYGLSGAKDIPVACPQGRPFPDYSLPSLFLFIVIGGAFLAGSLAVFSRFSFARLLAHANGILLVAWIGAQLAIIGFVSWLQPAMVAAALAVELLAFRLPASE